MKCKYLSLIFCLVSAFGCSFDREELNENLSNSIFYGVMEDVCGTKTFLGEDNYVRWSAGDEIMIFNGFSVADRYSVSETSAGQRSASFDYGGPVKDGFVSGYDIEHNVALYPLSEEVQCSSIMSDGQLEGYALVNVKLPSRQVYESGSFANGSYPMVALTNSVQDQRLAFKNVCGGVKLSLRGERSISSITLRGNNGELLAGDCEIITDLVDKKPEVIMSEETEIEVCLDCGENGVALDIVEGTTFIISVPPVNFTKGFSLVIEDTQGNEFILKTSKENEVVRSALLVMPEVSVEDCNSPFLELSEHEITISGDETVFDVEVSANVDYEVVLPDLDWIVESSDSDHSRRYFSVKANDDYASRETEITFRNLRHDLSCTLVIAQDGGKELPQYVLSTVYEVPSTCEGYFPSYPAGKDNEVIIIDYGDGCFGTSKNHTYQQAGEYAIKFYFDKPVTEISTCAFYANRIKEIIIPSTVEVIRNLAFYSSILEEVTFEGKSKLRSIEDSAFGYSKLKYISLPGSLEEVGYSIFGGCSSLENISVEYNSGHFYHMNIPDGDNYVLILAYSDDNESTIIAYPAGAKKQNLYLGYLSKVGDAAFTNCDNLITCSISGLETIGKYNFIYCKNLENVAMSQVRYIGESVLYDCDELKSVTLPEVVEIGNNSICDNASLRYVDITSPELSEISGIINNNPSLESVIIPEGVTSIISSFNALPSLKQVEVRALTPPVVEDSFDSFADGVVITVPAESIETYRNADFWKDYASCFIEMGIQ